MLTITCSRCGTKHFADEHHAGKHLKCSKCNDLLTIRNQKQTSVAPQLLKRSDQATRLTLSRVLQNLRSNRTPKRYASVAICLAIVTTLFLMWEHTASSQEGAISPSHNQHAHTSPTLTQLGYADDTSDESNPLLNGTSLARSRYTEGLGKLTIRNGTSEDAAVILTVSGSKRIARKVYVSSRSDFTLTDLTAGSYQVYFTTGTRWSSIHRRFRIVTGSCEFCKTLFFNETQLSSGTEYSHNMITLNPVPDGDVRVMPIGQKDFQSLMDSE